MHVSAVIMKLPVFSENAFPDLFLALRTARDGRDCDFLLRSRFTTPLDFS